MGLEDADFGFLEGRSLTDAAELLDVAELLEKQGHFGPAARFYEQANEIARASTAAKSVSHKAVRGRDECQTRARSRGEDCAPGFEPAFDEIRAAPRRFVKTYYRRQAHTLRPRFSRLSAAGDWPGMIALADAAAGLQKFHSSCDRIHAEYNCLYFAGVAHLKLRNHEQARACLTQAHRLARSSECEFPAAALAWDAFYLGSALYHAGAPEAEEALREAVERLQDLWQRQEEPVENRDDALVLLARFYERELDKGSDRAIGAARAVCELGHVPVDRMAQAALETVKDRARACLNVMRLLDETRARLAQADPAGATDLLTQATREAETARAPALQKLVQERLHEVAIQNPARIAEHASAVREMLARDAFDEANTLCDELEAAHDADPTIAEIRREITDAARGYIDQRIAAAETAIAAEKIEPAEAELERAQRAGDNVGSLPDEYHAALTKLNGLKATRLAVAAQRLGNQGRYREAFASLEQARALPLADANLTTKLASLGTALEQGQTAATDKSRREIRKLITEDRIAEARDQLTAAAELGCEAELEQERESVRRYSEAERRLDRADVLLGEHMHAKALEQVTEAVDITQSRGLLNRAESLKARIEEQLQLVAGNYVAISNKLAAIGAAAGTALWLLLWLVGDLDFFFSIWLGVGAMFFIWGGLECCAVPSVLAHNGSTHGLMRCAAGGVVFILSWGVHWFPTLLLGMATAGAVSYFLTRHCPAQTPPADQS